MKLCQIKMISKSETQENSKSVNHNLQCPAVLGLNCGYGMTNLYFFKLLVFLNIAWLMKTLVNI
jgi:hypothetical protein